jgi:isopentenyldiphosphate isomerase
LRLADEEVDVVDAEDRVIGRATRAEMRARRLRHRAAYILVFNSRGELFVHRRTAGKDVYPSTWDVAIGGVVEAGESYERAAERELGEEIGLHGAALDRVADLRYADRETRINGRVFRCTYDGPLRLQAEEIVAGEWLAPEEVERRIRELRFCPDGLEALRLWREAGGRAG